MEQFDGDIIRKVGDLEPPIEFYLKYPDGTAVDLTGATVTVRAMDDTDAFAWEGTATVVTAAEGHCRYALESDVTATAGLYYLEVIATKDGRPLTGPTFGFLTLAVNEGTPAATP